MAAYLIAEIRVTDAAGYEEYRNRISAVIAYHGGKYLVRGGKTELLEGADDPGRIVLLEFPSLKKLEGFFNSSDFTALKELRQRSATSRILAVEGV